MATYKNTRPTVIQRPNGKNIGPGGSFDSDPGEMNNPGMAKFAKAKYLVKTADTEPPPAPPAPPPAPEAPKAQPPKGPSQAETDARAKAAREAQEKAKALKDAQEKAGAEKRAAKIAAVKSADAEALLKMADGETDGEVNAAIEARAAELAVK